MPQLNWRMSTSVYFAVIIDVIDEQKLDGTSRKDDTFTAERQNQ